MKGEAENWDDLRYLAAVEKAGSMVSAARTLGTNPATVSRRMTRLAQALGFDPLIRTPAGWKIDDRLAGLVEKIEDFQGSITGFINGLRVADNRTISLSIGCPPPLTLYTLSRGLRQFRAENPTTKLMFNDAIMQVSLGVNDIFITPAQPESGRVVTKPLCQLRYGVYGYRDSEPNLGWVGMNSKPQFVGPMKIGEAYFGTPPAICTDDTVGSYLLMRDSHMPGILCHIVAEQDPDLILLSDTSDQFSLRFFTCYHESRRRDPTIQQALRWIDDSCARYITK